MNGWERVARDPSGACLGVADTVVDALYLRTQPDVTAPALAILQRGVLVYVWDVLPATEPEGEWLLVMVCQNPQLLGYAHSLGLVKISPHDDAEGAERLRAAVAAVRPPPGPTQQAGKRYGGTGA